MKRKVKRKKKVKRRNKMEVTRQKMGIEDIVQIYNFFGGIIGAWAIFYPNPFKLAITMSMIVTLIGFIIMFIYNKSVEFITKDSSRPFVGVTISLNSVAICTMGYFYSNIAYSTLFWIYCIICCVVIILFMVILKRDAFKNAASSILIVLSISSYSMGIITNVNYLYDNSKPTVYSTSITKKEIYESGVKFHVRLYQVWVSPLRSSDQNIRVIVSKEFYDAVYNDKEVQVCVQSGLLGLKWYYLET